MRNPVELMTDAIFWPVEGRDDFDYRLARSQASAAASAVSSALQPVVLTVFCLQCRKFGLAYERHREMVSENS